MSVAEHHSTNDKSAHGGGMDNSHAPFFGNKRRYSFCAKAVRPNRMTPVERNSDSNFVLVFLASSPALGENMTRLREHEDDGSAAIDFPHRGVFTDDRLVSPMPYHHRRAARRH